MRTSYSKKIVFFTGILFTSQTVLALVFSWFYRDMTVFMYSIPSTGGLFGASIVFYLNKSKMENLLKIKIAYSKFKLKVSKLIPVEAMCEIENEFMALEQAVDMKIDNLIGEAVNDDINTTSY